MLIVVIPLALLAALAYALSDFLEQRGAQRSVAAPAGTAVLTRLPRRLAAEFRSAGGTLRRMTRQKVWVAGWAVGTLAYLFQAAALHLGSVAVVQSLQVTSLIFTLPLSAIGRPVRLGPREWFGGAAVCTGLGIFLAVHGHAPPASAVHRGRLLFLLLMLLAGVGTLTVLAALRAGPVRATLLACAAGGSFATSATLVKLTATDLTTRGVPATAGDWPGYALAGVTLLGLVLQQLAFASGRLPVAATAMVIANPVAGTAVAVVGFGERLPATALGLADFAVG
ncbi:MAG: hypothetical protein V7637_1320, partial [Mycobacteriales bacterium]